MLQRFRWWRFRRVGWTEQGEPHSPLQHRIQGQIHAEKEQGVGRSDGRRGRELRANSLQQGNWEAGAICKVSSIHVNGWFGNFDKLQGFKAFHKDRFGEEANLSEWAFFGDSANDEPMFKAFEWSFGVANVRDFLPRLQSPPKWITPSKGGHGFVEGIEVLLTALE